MTNWYAVYTRPRCELKVAELFAKKKMESYCPLNKVDRQWMGTKVVKMPLFKACVFIRLQETRLSEVKSVDGVINFMYWLGKPAVIRDIEIEMLQRFLNVHKNVEVEKTPVNPLEMVTLAETPWLQKEGGVVAVGAIGPRLLLPSLGYRLIASEYSTEQNFANQFIAKHQDSLIKIN